MRGYGKIILAAILLAWPAWGHAAETKMNLVVIEDGEPTHYYSNTQSPFHGSGDQWNLYNERRQIIGTSDYDFDSVQVLSSNSNQMAITLDVTYHFKNGMTVTVEDARMVISFIDGGIAGALGMPEFGDGLVSNFLEGEISSVSNAGGRMKMIGGAVSYRSRHETVGGKFFRCIDCLGILKFVLMK
ncbi:MAG: hypothetical protein IT573_12225 [Deltaproteobacteria bacterium]|nr:hypothetical protein [Deltaproteobacteria bacterium]